MVMKSSGSLQVARQVDEDQLVKAFQRLAFDTTLATTAAALGALIEAEKDLGHRQLADFVEECLLLPHPWPTANVPEPSKPALPLWCREGEMEVQRASLGGA
eukprot:Skav216950  [mRNA]  locus=scaffold3396:288837:290952:+ [translate_table: standard]